MSNYLLTETLIRYEILRLVAKQLSVVARSNGTATIGEASCAPKTLVGHLDDDAVQAWLVHFTLELLTNRRNTDIKTPEQYLVEFAKYQDRFLNCACSTKFIGNVLIAKLLTPNGLF